MRKFWSDTFDPQLINCINTLITVTSLPKSLAEFSLVTNPTGDGVLAIGGINGSDRQSAIYELFCNRFRYLDWAIKEFQSNLFIYSGLPNYHAANPINILEKFC